MTSTELKKLLAKHGCTSKLIAAAAARHGQARRPEIGDARTWEPQGIGYGSGQENPEGLGDRELACDTKSFSKPMTTAPFL